MIAVALALGAIRWIARPRYRAIILGLLSAALLYLIFYAGGAFVDAYHPFGITSASERAVYSLIAGPSNPVYLQILVLLFDSAGFESFFRGALQGRLQSKFGFAAVPMVAAVDACIHLLTMNPVWVGGTFITDVVWGFTYYYGGGLQSSFLSHLAWDVAIFVVHPVT